MNNNWKKIWENRNDVKLDLCQSPDEVFIKLKAINGFDVMEEGIPLNSFIKQYKLMIEKLRLNKGESVFEVGCGCGANLYLFYQNGYTIGGVDYSNKLINIMKRVFSEQSLIECACNEAININTEIKYDSVFSNGVFHYFPDLDYAYSVVEKMYQKANSSISILDVHNVDTKMAFEEYRRKTIPDYDERYKDLPKLFFQRNFSLNLPSCIIVKY